MVTTQEKDLSVKEVAKRLDRHHNTIRTAIHEGRIQAVKVLGRWRVQVSEVERVLRGGMH